MGIAYFIVYGAYSLIVYTIYKSMKKGGASKLIRRVVLAFFILLPTYDIIISNILKYYYCNFTELEKINRKIDRPEVIFVEDIKTTFNKKYNLMDAESYISFLGLKFIQIKRKNDNVHTYYAKGEYIDHNGYIRKHIEEIVNYKKTVRYKIIEDSLELPWFINKFLWGRKTKIIDLENNTTIALSKAINHKKYNFIFIDTGYFLRGKICGGDTTGEILLKKVIKGESNAK